MKFATPNEAAQHFGGTVSAQAIRRGAQRGRYPHIMVGGRILVDMDALAPIVEREKQYRDRISTTELSQATGLTASAIRRGVAEGWLPSIREGRHLRFHLATVEAALKKRMSGCVETEE